VPAVPPAWALHREGRTREVRYALYRAPGHHAAVTLRPDDPPATTEWLWRAPGRPCTPARSTPSPMAISTWSIGPRRCSSAW